MELPNLMFQCSSFHVSHSRFLVYDPNFSVILNILSCTEYSVRIHAMQFMLILRIRPNYTLYDSYFVQVRVHLLILSYIWVAEWMNFSNYSYRCNCNCCWMIVFPTACHFYFRDGYLFYFTAAISSSRSARYDLVFLRNHPYGFLFID